MLSPGHIESVIEEVLREGPGTVEALLRRLAAVDPMLAARGARWLESQLRRSPMVGILADGRFALQSPRALSPEGEEEDEEDAQVAARSRRVDPSLAERFVVLDLEANPDRARITDHEIVEIGACLVSGGRVSDEFHALIRPTRPLTAEFTHLTGITPSDVESAEDAPAVLARFIQFVDAHPLVAHNGFGYDFPLLFESLARAGLPLPTSELLDTLDLAHVVFPRVGRGGGPNADGGMPPSDRTLSGLALHLGVTQTPAQHRALEDARLTVAVMQALLEHLSAPSPARALQRWLLHEGDHPWAAFLPPGHRPDLSEVVPLPDLLRSEPPTQRFDPDAAIAPLKPGGVLMQGDLVPRPQQIEMAMEIAHTLAKGDRLLIEAPTGTGKTLSYLVPAIAYSKAAGRPVVVATFSKVLQDQVAQTLRELDVPLGPVRWALLKGRENYIDLEQLDAILNDGPQDEAEALALAVIAGWVSQTPTGDWEDLPVWALEQRTPFGRLRWELRVTEEPGIAHTPLQERDFYRRAKERIDNAHIAVLNHAVLVSHPASWSEAASDLILDEAHNLEDAATSALTEEIGEAWAQHVLDSIHPRGRRRGLIRRYSRATQTSLRGEQLRGVIEQVQDCREALRSFGQALVDYVRERAGARRQEVERFGASYRLRAGVDTGRPAYQVVLAASQGLTARLDGLRNSIRSLPVPEALRGPYRRERLEAELSRAAKSIYEVSNALRAILRCSDETRWIYVVDLSLEEDRWTWNLRQVPLSVGPLLSELWDELHSVVLTSATLRVAGDFGHLQERLGLETARTRALPSPFTRISKQELLVIPDHLPVPRGDLLAEFTQEAADEVARLLTLSRGRALVLFTSRERLEAVRRHVQPLLDSQQLPVLAQGEGPAMTLLERFRSETATSLLATRSFWEGVDIPGESLSLLVMEKLPFDPPNDPIVAARVDALLLRGRDPFAGYVIPRAVLRFVQGVGRLIRSEDDVGVVVVLDKRLRKAIHYREAFLGSLVGPPRILRPTRRNEGYREIAEHLEIDLDVELWERIHSLPTADPWGDLPVLSPEEARDEQLVRERLEEVRQRFGFTDWRPGQLEVMVRFLRGEDVLAILPTGSGKSLTYQIPALIGDGVTLVISPLIALMRDQLESLRGRRLTRAAAIYSGISQTEQDEILERASGGAYKLLYVSPERLWTKRFRAALRGVQVARVAVDEAHCVSQWGHSFRPEYAAISEALEHIAQMQGERPPILAVTATATPAVAGEIIRLLRLREPGNKIIRMPDRPELHYYVEDCKDREVRDLQVAKIVEAFRGKPAIVYVPTRADAVRLAELLRGANHLARAYHGGMESAERLHVEEAFRDGEIDVVVATKAFGLGIDKQDVELIIHLEMPASVEDYIQETGRAARGAIEGRGPERGTCVLLRTPGDCRIHGYFVRSAAPDLEIVKAVWDRTAPGEAYIVPSEIAHELQMEPESADVALGIAVRYLTEDGSLERLEDVAWEGRIWVPPDAKARLRELSQENPELEAMGKQVIETVDRLGLDYRAPQWGQATGRSPEQAEEDLLELSRRDLLAFVSWKTAWHLRRRSPGEPDWAAIERRCRERQQIMRDLSHQAKQFRDNDQQCRRAWMLTYLGGEPPSSCQACDVCVPNLPRPWRGVALSREDLETSIPAEAICLAMLNDLGDHTYSAATLIRSLRGEDGPSTRNPRLRESFWFGKLRLLGPDRIREILQGLVDRGWAEWTTLTYDGREYESIRITETGRRQR